VLLSWIFYFPQALPWYIDTFGTASSLTGWPAVREDPARRQILVQGLLLAVALPLLLGALLPWRISWLLVLISAASGAIIAFSVALASVGLSSGALIGGVAGILGALWALLMSDTSALTPTRLFNNMGSLMVFGFLGLVGGLAI
jgi:hypothetical protein